MNTFQKIANAAHKFGDGLAGATMGTASGEFLSETGFQSVGDSLKEYGNSSISSAIEASYEVPLIGAPLSHCTSSVLTGVRDFSRLVGKGTAFLYKNSK